MKKFFFVIFIFFSSILSAQQVYFCQSYTEDGEPIDTNNKWQFGIDGGYVFLLFDNEGAFDDPLLYVFIDKNNGEEFKPFDSKLLKVNKDDSWAAIDYNFKENGEFKVYFMNSTQTILASSVIKIEITQSNAPDRNTFSSRYYDNTEFIFCEVVIGGKPYNILRSISIEESDGEVFVYLRNDDSLSTDTIHVDCWESTGNDNDFDKFIQSKKYKIESSWIDTFFKYKFVQPGEFKLSIYNNRGTLIKSKVIRVYK